MMERDYAKRMTQAKRPKKSRAMQWIIFLIAVTIVVVGIYALRFPATFQQIAAKFQHKRLHPLNHAATPALAEGNQEQDIHFDFYTELPNVQVKSLQPTISAAVNKPAVYDP